MKENIFSINKLLLLHKDNKEFIDSFFKTINFNEIGTLHIQYSTKEHGYINYDLKQSLLENMIETVPESIYLPYVDKEWINYQINGYDSKVIEYLLLKQKIDTIKVIKKELFKDFENIKVGTTSSKKYVYDDNFQNMMLYVQNVLQPILNFKKVIDSYYNTLSFNKDRENERFLNEYRKLLQEAKIERDYLEKKAYRKNKITWDKFYKTQEKNDFDYIDRAMKDVYISTQDLEETEKLNRFIALLVKSDKTKVYYDDVINYMKHYEKENTFLPKGTLNKILMINDGVNNSFDDVSNDNVRYDIITQAFLRNNEVFLDKILPYYEDSVKDDNLDLKKYIDKGLLYLLFYYNSDDDKGLRLINNTLTRDYKSLKNKYFKESEDITLMPILYLLNKTNKNYFIEKSNGLSWESRLFKKIMIKEEKCDSLNDTQDHKINFISILLYCKLLEKCIIENDIKELRLPMSDSIATKLGFVFFEKLKKDDPLLSFDIKQIPTLDYQNEWDSACYMVKKTLIHQNSNITKDLPEKINHIDKITEWLNREELKSVENVSVKSKKLKI